MSDDNSQNSAKSDVPLDKLVSSMRGLEIDHEPDGFPAVQMKEISALCDAVENAVPSIDLLQKRLENGQYLSRQHDGAWWLFEEDGNGICGGANIRDILINLIWIDC